MLHLKLPHELAEDLIENKYARKAFKPRGSFLECVISGASEAAVWVTLLQAPATVQYYADWLKRHAGRNGGTTKVTVKGSRGVVVEIEVAGDESSEEVAERIKTLLLE